MKLVLACIAFGLAVITSAQVLNYKGADGDWSVSAGGGSLSFVGANEYKFQLQKAGGQVYIRSQKQGLEIWSPSLTANIVQKKGVSSPIKSVVASGSLRIVRRGAGESSELSGSGGTFKTRGTMADVTIPGPVRIISARAGKESLNVSGGRATAVLSNTAGSRPLQTATITDNVRVQAVQAQDGSKVTMTAARAVYALSGGESTITLTGGVKASGGAQGNQFNMQVSKAVLYLNREGAVYKFLFT